MTVSVHRFIRWYNKDNDSFVGEERILKIKLQTLINLIQINKGDPYLYAIYPIKRTHDNKIQKYLKHKISLNKWDYFLECDSIQKK